MVPAPHADAAAMRGRLAMAYISSVGTVTRVDTATDTAGTPVGALAGGIAAPGIGAAARTRSWSITPTPEGGAFLSAVSCVRASKCVAVGESAAGEPLAEVWNGSAWSITPTPDPSPNNVLYGVSCVSFSYCVAVGQSYNGSADQTLVEVWNGTTWSISPSPDPSGVIDSHLFAVSCVSSSYCVTVGLATTESANQTLAEVERH